MNGERVKRFFTWAALITGRLWATVLAILVTIILVITITDIQVQRHRITHLVPRLLQSQDIQMTVYDLSVEQLEILIRIEDPTFFTNHGLDHHTPGAGLTSMTESVGKKLFFHPFKPGIRKIRLAYLSRYALYPLVSKQDLLTLHLNLMYYGKVDGQPVTGLANAANAYYGKSVQELSRREYLSLIAMLPGPGWFSLIDHPDQNALRVQRIEAVLAGDYQPKGLMDVYYEGAPVIYPRPPREIDSSTSGK